MTDPTGKFGAIGIGISMSIGSGMQGRSAGANMTAGQIAMRSVDALLRVSQLILLLVRLDHELQVLRAGRPPVSAEEFLHDFITGRGAPVVVFDDTTPMVQQMRNHSHVLNVRSKILEQFAQGNNNPAINENHSYATFAGIPIALKDAFGLNGGWPAAPIIGSYEMRVHGVRVNNNTVKIFYWIDNKMGRESATRIPVLGYLDKNHPLIKDWGLPRSLLSDTQEDVIMKDKRMILDWSEEVRM